MKSFPAIALIETGNIPAGIVSADAMAKASPVALLKSGTVSHGKFIVLVGGSVAAVEEAFREGQRVAGGDCLDILFLPDVDPAVYTKMMGEKSPPDRESLGILETPTLAGVLAAADAAVKGAAVDLLELRLGDRYGGKGYALFNAEVENMEAAGDICRAIGLERNTAFVWRLIPRMDAATRRQVSGDLHFREADSIQPEDGERDVTG